MYVLFSAPTGISRYRTCNTQDDTNLSQADFLENDGSENAERRPWNRRHIFVCVRAPLFSMKSARLIYPRGCVILSVIYLVYDTTPNKPSIRKIAQHPANTHQLLITTQSLKTALYPMTENMFYTRCITTAQPQQLYT